MGDPDKSDGQVVRVRTTGSFTVQGPVNEFSYAIYRTRSGKVITMPIEVAGREITLQRVRAVPSEL